MDRLERRRHLDLHPREASPVAFFDPARGVLAIVERATRLTKDGSEEIDGAGGYVLRGKAPVSALTAILGNAPSARLLSLELCTGKEDFLLTRIRVRGRVSAADRPDATRSVEIWRFDAPVRIGPPAAP